MELADPKVRTLFTSYDVIGSRHTLIVAYAPERWRREAPKLYQATFAALAEAMDIIRKDTRAAAIPAPRTFQARPRGNPCHHQR